MPDKVVANMVDSCIEKESSILNDELVSFLEKHSLPADKYRLQLLGYTVVTEVKKNLAFEKTGYTFKLCKIVDLHEIVITHKFNNYDCS